MSARRSMSDASVSDSVEDDEFPDTAFEGFHDHDALSRELVRSGLFGETDNDLDMESDEASSLASPPAVAATTSSRRTRPGQSSGRSNAARMLEALETLSHEAEGDVPQSLRGLLEQVHSGADGSVLGGMFPFSQLLQSSSTSPRFARMLEQIGLDQPMCTQMQCLSELCETLSLSTEEALAVSAFNVDAFVPALVALVRNPPSMDVLLLAARALSTILELFPSAAIQKATAEQVIPSLCKKLLEIEYMDVAELALQMLDKVVCKSEAALSVANTVVPNVPRLCAQYRKEVIQENGIVALLQFVDFFPLEIQRRAARIVCHLCTDFPLALTDKMRQGLPYMTNLLRSFDNEILQSSFAGLQKLGESAAFSQNEEFASMVASEEICGLLLEKLTSYASLEGASGSSAVSQLSPEGCTSILRFLSCLLSCVPSDMSSVSVVPSAAHLRFVRLPPIVTALLAKQDVISENQLLRETLTLLIVILPTAEGFSCTDTLPSATLSLVHDILPLITRVYDVISRADLRYDCLGVVLRSCSLIHARRQSLTVQEHVELSRLAAFLARVLRPKRSSKDLRAFAPVKADKNVVQVQLALKIVEVPLQHASAREAAKDIFERHGVTSIIRFYASSPEHETRSDFQEIQATSLRLVRDYFGDESSIVSVMAQLERVVEELQTTLVSTHGSESAQTTSLLHVLLKLRDFAAQGDDLLTAHEIACSGLVKVLIQILSVDKGRQAFSRLLAMHDATSNGPGFVTSLLQCLQNAISSEKDAFSVSAGGKWSAGLSSGSITSDLDQLTQHIKVHVLIGEAKPVTEPDNEDQSTHQADFHDEEEPKERSMKEPLAKWKDSSYTLNKRSVHDTVVLVEPLARIETIEDFIADKLFGRNGDTEAILDEAAGVDAETEEAEDVEESGEFANNVVKPRRVIAVYKGQVLPTDMSILEAIVKLGDVDAYGNENEKLDADRPKVTSGSPVWTATAHDITFRVAAVPESNVDAIALESTCENAHFAASFSSLSLSAVSEQWGDDVWELLLLLKLVRQQCLGQSFQAPLTFVNSYLSLQVRRALQQPVAVVTNSLPEWCLRLVTDFSFVIDFETRYHFMYATTCGCSRAIQYLCRSVWRKAVMEERAPVRHTRSTRRRYHEGATRTRTFGLDNISQMVKLPRLKVRVARSRLLRSAMKLVAIYGGKKAVIEIEFLGEVGTGLGPTTEFFTLVCQQIQSKQLQLWRDDDEGLGRSVEEEQKVGARGEGSDESHADHGSLAIRGYHRVAVYHCIKCKALYIPVCSVHGQLLTHEKKIVERQEAQTSDDDCDLPKTKSFTSMRWQTSRKCTPQCAQCLDDCDWSCTAAFCDCNASNCEDSESTTKITAGYTLKWWILSDEEAQYLAKVFPRHSHQVVHPVLQCAHCDTVNFPGTDAGIVVMDGDRMVSRSGRRMFERDYRAVTKHVSPLCEGTPLNVMTSVITRSDVDMLVENLAQSPEVLESEIESLHYLSEAALGGGNIGDGPPVTAPFGLYPKPYVRDQDVDESKAAVTQDDAKDATRMAADAASLSEDDVDVLTWFRFLGRFVGQAILDERLLNLPFARPFLRALRGEKMAGNGVSVDTSLSFVEEVDPALARSLRYLHNLARKYAIKMADDDMESEDVAVWTTEVEAMCLSFTLIGADEIPLEVGGKDTLVTLHTLQRYVRLNVEFLLHRTIESQVKAFRQGFEEICGSHGDHQLFRFLQAFDVCELEALLSDRGAGDSMWDRDGNDLREHMVCDHGYTANSRAIANLVSILCELSVDEQRLFVRFVTGANRLPLGGLRHLDPKLTVVRKLTESHGETMTGSEENDAVLPSASTCTNYLKLPDYSTRDIMKQRLLYCINEGQCSFHLS